MDQPAIPLMIGDTLRIVIAARDPASGNGIDMTGYEVAAIVETEHGARLHDFVIAPPGPLGFILLAAPEETASWPAGDLNCAVRLTSPAGDQVTSPPFIIRAVHSAFD